MDGGGFFSLKLDLRNLNVMIVFNSNIYIIIITIITLVIILINYIMITATKVMVPW